MHPPSSDEHTQSISNFILTAGANRPMLSRSVKSLSRARFSWPVSWSPTPCSLSRSEEHTSELQSLRHLVCRLLLETISRGIWDETSCADFHSSNWTDRKSTRL